MHIVLSCRGSRGDVQPMIEIAAGLARAGHAVRLCLPATFAAQARARGVEPVASSEDSHGVMRRFGAGWQAARQAMDWFSDTVDEQFELLLAESAGADVLVSSVNETAAPSVAEHRGLAYFRVAYAPILPGGQPPPLLPWQWLPAAANRLAWRAVNAGVGLIARRRVDRWRRRLGLGPMGPTADYFAGRAHTLLAINRSLAPPRNDWQHRYSYTGYCHPPVGAELDPALERFLAAGPPPVYLGFGSVNLADPAGFTRRVLGAVARAGLRAVLGAGWAGLGERDLPAGVRLVGDVDHARLFTRLAGVAHHGGSGTLHTAARAGVPQFVMPQIADQFYWGARVERLGLGPAPAAPGRLGRAELAARLAALAADGGYRERARALAQRVARDRGVERAVAAISRAA